MPKVSLILYSAKLDPHSILSWVDRTRTDIRVPIRLCFIETKVAAYKVTMLMINFIPVSHAKDRQMISLQVQHEDGHLA